MVYRNRIKHGTPIYETREEIEKMPFVAPKEWMVNLVINNFTSFHTDVDMMMDELERYGQVRNFNFQELRDYIVNTLHINTNGVFGN